MKPIEIADKAAELNALFCIKHGMNPNAVFVRPDVYNALVDSYEIKYDESYADRNGTIMGNRIVVVPYQKEDILVGIVHSEEELKDKKGIR